MRYGDIVIQKKTHDIQQEGVFDNWRWVVLSAEHKGKRYLECVSFDGKTHASLPLIKETKPEVIGNIGELLDRKLQAIESHLEELSDFSVVNYPDHELTGAIKQLWRKVAKLRKDNNESN